MTFEKFALDYSMKNIPISNEKEYKLQLLNKARDFMRRMRIRAYFYEKFVNEETNNEPRKETYGFKSNFNPTPSKNLLEFEKDLIALVKSVKFRRWTNKFQEQMKKDAKDINKTDKIIVKADKTSNMYKLTIDEYNKLLLNNITKTYRKADTEIVDKINKDAKDIAVELELDDRINQLPAREAYITLKDHKINFDRTPKCRLINPTKSEIGKISKIILENINKNIRSKLMLLQWTDPQQVVSWFDDLKDKKNLEFIKFDVREFYPSITEELLERSIKFAKRHHKITKQEIRIINNAAQSVLYHDDQVWIKRKDHGNPTFDITMGGYHGAETCELVGLFILNEISKFVPKQNIGLYRDDGLMVIKKQSGQKTEKLKQKLHKFAHNIGLGLEIEGPMTRTDFLDIALDLEKQTYAPYRKENNETKYIKTESNHPRTIINQIFQ